MPTCWSCRNEAGDDPFCPSCGKIQPSRPRNLFAVVGLSPRYHLDVAALEKTYRDLSRKVHPDKFARADARERRFALEQSTQLNEAYKALKNPVSRAGYLLQSNGLPIPSDDAGKPGAGQSLPLEFYEEVMEDREALADAKTGGPAAVGTLAAKVIGKRDGALAAIDRAFTAWEETQDRDVLVPAAVEFAKLRYYARFLDDIEGKRHD